MKLSITLRKMDIKISKSEQWKLSRNNSLN